MLYRSVLQRIYRESDKKSQGIRELLPVLEAPWNRQTTESAQESRGIWKLLRVFEAPWNRQTAESAHGELEAPSPDVRADIRRANEVEKLTQHLASSMRAIKRRAKHAWNIMAVQARS